MWPFSQARIETPPRVLSANTLYLVALQRRIATTFCVSDRFAAIGASAPFAKLSVDNLSRMEMPHFEVGFFPLRVFRRYTCTYKVLR